MNAKALKMIKEFEGLRLTAYNDGLGVATIGYGTTRWPDGSPVRLGQSCTEKQAEQMLIQHLEEDVLPNLERIPDWDEMSEGKQAALMSFAYNLGSRFYKSEGFDTISRYLANKDWQGVPAAFSLYVNPGSSVEEGLKRRRAAEVKLWEETA